MEKEKSNERMPGQSRFLPPRGPVLAEELEAAASGSGQLLQRLRVVAGRRESLEPTTARGVCSACDRTRLPPRPGAGGVSPAFLGSQPRRPPGRLVSARKEVAGAGSRAS